MIPLITQTARLTIVAASRALLTAELHKPQYFPVLLGAVLPDSWPLVGYEEGRLAYFLEQLTAGGRTAAGWYNWYALRKADGEVPRTLIGMGGFMGPPDALGVAEISFAIAEDWRGQGLAAELVQGLVQQAAATGMVRQLLAHAPPGDIAAQKVLLHNGFTSVGSDLNGKLRFERVVVPAPDPLLQDPV